MQAGFAADACPSPGLISQQLRRFNIVNWPQVNINYLAALKGDLSPLSSYP